MLSPKLLGRLMPLFSCRLVLLRVSLLVIILFSFVASTNAANRFWVASLPSNWNNTANWSTTSGGASGASVPGSGDAVFFDNVRVGSCSIDAAVNVASISVASGYTGTISQTLLNTITVSGAATFSGGTFTGGLANITISGTFTISGTAFLSTAAILELRGDAAFTSGSFTHNNGTVRINGSGSQAISGTSPTFYILEFVGTAHTYTISSIGNITVMNSLNTSGSLFYNIATGTIDVKGDINSSNTATGCGGDATININGTGIQNFTGSATAGGGALPQLTINKTLGTLNLANFPAVSNNFTYTAGTVVPGTSTFCFTHGNVGSYNVNGTLSFANIEFPINTSLLTLTIAATITATGDLTIAGAGNLVLNTGNINVNGNITLTNTGNGGGGSATINIVGTGSESMDGTALVVNQSRLPIININKASGTLSLLGNISFSANLTYTAGTINAGTSTCYLVNNLTITGTFSIYNLTISAAGNTTITVASGSTITATNILDLENGGNYITINTGTIAVQGNIINNNSNTTGGGTGTILINGTGAQSITSTGIIYQGTFPAITINKTSGVLTFPSLITERSNWTYIAGTLDVTTNNSTIVFSNSLTITGSHTLNNVNFDGAGNYTFTIAAATVLTISGNMSLSGTASFPNNNISLSGGTINLLGNLNLTNTGIAGGGSTVIAFVGTTDQAITGTLLIDQSRLPAITINKPSGILTFPSLITVRGNWTYTTGSYDVTTNNSNIVFANSLTISGNHALNNITFDGSGNYTISLAGTTLTANGNMSMSGTAAFPNNNISLNGGTINLFGNLNLTNTATAGGGTTVIDFVASVNQSITSSLLINQCNLPAITINKPAGTLTFPSLITVRGNWTYTAGTLDVTTNNSTVVFANILTITGTHSLNNVNLEGNGNNTYTVSTGTLLTVTGTLTTSGSSNVSLSTPVNAATAIQAQGDITITNTALASGGTGTILINGTGAQAFTSSAAASQGRMPYIKIQKVSGTLTLGGIISESRDWTYVSGTVAPSTSTVVFGGNSLAVSSNGMNFNNVSVTSNTTTLSNNLSANGNLAISGTGILAPGSNTINLAGNWSNYGTAGFTEATSTVNFNGAALQTITSPGGENFTNLTVNNTSTGIQLANNATIATTFTMTQGNIDLNGNTLTLGLSVANNGTLSRTTGTIINTGSFVRWFKAATIASGSITGLFPMGTATNYRPFYVSAAVTAPTTGGTIAVAYTDATTNSLTPYADGASTIVVRKNFNWGVTTANGLAGGTYDLQVQGTGFGLVGNVNDLHLTLASSAVGTIGVNGGTVTNPQVNRTGLSLANLANTFYVGSINASSSPLPITLISFTAAVENDIVELDWETAAEIMNDHFTIQRSADAINWQDIKIIKGSGNTSVDSYYKAFDENPLAGISYYRLQQTDFDGMQSYSAIRKINFNKSASISIYPNPATDYLVIKFATDEKLNIVLLNSNGQIVNTPVASNGNSMSLYVSGIEAGVYFIRIDHKDFTETRKVIIRK